MIPIIFKLLTGRLRNIVILNSGYSFLILILYRGRFDESNTLLISSDTMPYYISDKFSNCIRIRKLPSAKIQKMFYFLKYKIKYFILKSVIKLKSRKIDFYGCDHYFFSDLLSSSNYTLIEDGLINYQISSNKINFFYRLFIKKPFGLNEKCKRIILTGAKKIPKIIFNKVEILDIYNSSFIKDIDEYFKIDRLYIEHSIKNWILIPQGFDEFCWCSEDEKINLYKTLLKKEGFNENDRLYIKPHPREFTNYEKYFPDATILKYDIPLEIYSLKDINFNYALTIYSTAIFNINAKCKIFTGTNDIGFLKEKNIKFGRKVFYDR